MCMARRVPHLRAAGRPAPLPLGHRQEVRREVKAHHLLHEAQTRKHKWLA